jgi:transitional endoplasmic reticulum ATPase
MTTKNSFVAWLEQMRTEGEVRLSVMEGGDWVNRRSLITNVNTIEAEPTPYREEVRYYVRPGTSGTEHAIESWTRYAFPIVSGDGEALNTTERMELVVEFSQAAAKEDVPRTEADSIVLPSEQLQVDRDDTLAPVAADRVAGLSQEKDRLTRFLQTDNADWGLAEETGIILEGPPGTGKTELVIELCQELYGSMPVMISGPEILSKWVGESERMLRKKFAEARNADQDQPVLYIDELDAIARTRSEASDDYSAQIVAQLLVLLDGVEAKQEDEQGTPLKVITSTNLSHVIDPALRRPGRLGSRPIQFERPDPQERAAILHHYLEQVRRSPTGELDDDLHSFVTGDQTSVLDTVVAETEGFTGADLEDLIQAAVSQLQKQGKTTLSASFLKTIVQDEFDPANVVRSELIDPGNESGVPFDDEIHSRIYTLLEGEETARDVAIGYFNRLAESVDPDQERTFKYRETTPAEFLADDPVRAKENVIETFHHAESERICLYIKDTEQLVKTREQSSLINQLIGVLNEQILQWNHENLLILDPMPDKYSSITEIEGSQSSSD